jgi:hypothetical protein
MRMPRMVPMDRVATLFPALGSEGQHRAAAIRAMVTQLGYRYREERRYTVRAGMQAQLCDDVAIYDLSGNDDSDGPYRALVSTYVSCDHVLLISRDYMPANLLPVRSGGAPPYPYPIRKLPDGRQIGFPAQMVRGEAAEEWVAESDHSMLAWLRRQLTELAAAPKGRRLPREGSDNPLWSASPSTVRYIKDLQPHPMHRDPSTAFLSYRGVHSAEAFRLARELLARGDTGDDVHQVRVVGSAEFALDGELMSAGQRWMVFEYLGMLIQDASQLWALRTEDYLNSWWTLGELVYSAIARERAQKGRIPRAPRIRILDPVSGRLTDDLGDLDIRPSKRDLGKVTGITVLTQPGVSSMAARTMQSRLRRPPKGASPRRTWQSFWNDLLIDRRAVEGGQGYTGSPRELLAGISAMTVVDPARAAAAVAEGNQVVAEDGSRWRLTELPPRILFDRPLATRPDMPVLTRLRTFHIL